MSVRITSARFLSNIGKGVPALSLMSASITTKKVDGIVGSVIQKTFQSYTASSTEFAKPFKVLSWLFGEPTSQDNGDSNFPEIEEESSDADGDGDLPELEEDGPGVLFETKKLFISSPGSLSATVLRVCKTIKPTLAGPIVFAFKDTKETSVVNTRASLEILYPDIVSKTYPETLEQIQSVAQTTPPKTSFWDMIKNALRVVGSAFTSAGGIVAYYAFPSTQSSE